MIKYFVRTTNERSLDGSFERELGEDFTLLIDYNHNSGKAFMEQLLTINEYDCVVMEDDIILCKDFKKKIEEAISLYPNDIINFFTEPMRYMKTKKGGCFSYNQCVYFPKGFGKIIYDTVNKYNIRKERQEVIMRDSLLRLHKMYIIYRPCLVQHIDDGSLMGHDKVKFCRRSPYFIDYLDELGLTHEEAEIPKNKQKLIKLMQDKFKEIDSKKGVKK